VIVIRPATRQDRAFVLSLADRLAEFNHPRWRTAEEIAEGDRRALASAFDSPKPDEALFVAELHRKPAGCLLLWTLEDYFSGERHTHISVLAVAREAEGKGVGRALIEHAERWARERGHARLTLSVFEANERARHLYERTGFETELRRYVKPLSR
jgi:ribosomal protein S18 acetylase RimI-like enzyme